MKTFTVSLFAGQGAQFHGMGRSLFDKYEYHMRAAHQLLGYSVAQLCAGEIFDLNNTAYTQPALFVVNILHYLESLDNQGAVSEAFIGHSLGEYCALFAAGAFSFETALTLVQQRGRCMAQCPAGAMAAVTGLPREQVESLLETANFSDLTIANFNSPTQFIISGDSGQLQLFHNSVLEKHGRFYLLPVSGAFHSRHMTGIAGEFKKILQQADIYPLHYPVLSNVTGEMYPQNDREQLIELLVKQLSHPVRWQQCIENLPADSQILAYEHGPKPVVGPLAQQILGERITLMN